MINICKFIPKRIDYLKPILQFAPKHKITKLQLSTIGNSKILNKLELHLQKPISFGQLGRSQSNQKLEEKTIKTEVSQPIDIKTLPKKVQLKQAFRDYGATIVVFHVAISLCSLSICYSLISSGLDLVAVLKYLGVSEEFLTNKIASGASTFVVAYAVHKMFAPVRISITLGSTPFIVRYLRNRGFLKASTK